jgi:hypothetical protein
MLLHLVSIIVDQHHTRWILPLLLAAACSPCILLVLLVLLCVAVWWQHVLVLQYPHHCCEHVIQPMAGRLLGTTPQHTTANNSATLTEMTHSGKRSTQHSEPQRSMLEDWSCQLSQNLACTCHALHHIDDVMFHQAIIAPGVQGLHLQPVLRQCMK